MCLQIELSTELYEAKNIFVNLLKRTLGNLLAVCYYSITFAFIIFLNKEISLYQIYPDNILPSQYQWF